ncbi:TonB-dependent receptor [Fusobacterium sp. PH5-44]|uniref:TonB-dependent receptor n=1 Tax=unclassified Fusobacterium TaxID=2648384 RepID=UPI003D1B7F5E
MSFKKLALYSLIFSSSIFASSTSTDDDNYAIDLGNSVIYSSTGFQTTVRDVASNPTIVISEDIEKKHYATVEEILRDIPSVNVQYQMGMPVIDMRGQGTAKAMTNVQLLVDGVRGNASDTSHIGTPVNTIAPNQIERIEVIPGGGAVLYGSGTAGGVINVITKKQTGPRASAGYSYGNYRGNMYDVSVGHTIGNLDIDLSYSRSDKKGYRRYSEEDVDHFNGKLRYDINDDHTITFRYSKYKSDAEVPNYLTYEQLKDDRKQSAVNPGDVFKWDRDKEEISLEYSGKITDKLELNVLGYIQDTDMHYKYKTSSTAVMSPMIYMTTDTNMNAAFDDEKKGISAKLKYTYETHDSNIIVGIDYLDNELNRVMKMNMLMNIYMKGSLIRSTTVPASDLDVTASKESISAFVLNTYKYNEKLEFIQGFRYEQADYKYNRISKGAHIDVAGSPKDHDNWAAELAANYLYSDTGNVYLKWERGYTSPAPALVTNTYRDQAALIAAGYDAATAAKLASTMEFNGLKSETYNTFELGFRDSFEKTDLNGAIFYTLTDDEISSSGHAAHAIYSSRNTNLDKTQRFGFELSARQYLGKFTFTESYSYINAKIKKASEKDYLTGKRSDIHGKKVAGVSPHKLSFGILYKYNDRFDIGGDVVYRSAYYLSNTNVGGKKNGYAVTNIRANFKATNSLNIYAGINNVFDKKYHESLSYASATDTYSYMPAEGRNYYVGFKFQF